MRAAHMRCVPRSLRHVLPRHWSRRRGCGRSWRPATCARPGGFEILLLQRIDKLSDPGALQEMADRMAQLREDRTLSMLRMVKDYGADMPDQISAAALYE